MSLKDNEKGNTGIGKPSFSLFNKLAIEYVIIVCIHVMYNII